MNTGPEQEQEWLRQNNLIYGGLIGIGVVLVQPFLTAPSLDASGLVASGPTPQATSAWSSRNPAQPLAADRHHPPVLLSSGQR